MTIVKIGGSVVTNKAAQKPQMKKKTIVSLAREFSSYGALRKEAFVLVHGAGSFGHPVARKYELNNFAKKKKNALGVGFTHAAMHQLSSSISEIFLHNRCPVFCFSPSALAEKANENVQSFQVKPIRDILSRGLIPLLYGDVVTDEKSQFSILSGDQIVSFLSNALLPKRVLFLSDIDGIFSEDPKRNKKAQLLKEISRKELQEMMFEENAKHDVTGSMKGKIAEILHMQCDVYVVNGLKKGNFLRALKGENVGTKIFGTLHS